MSLTVTAEHACGKSADACRCGRGQRRASEAVFAMDGRGARRPFREPGQFRGRGIRAGRWRDLAAASDRLPTLASKLTINDVIV